MLRDAMCVLREAKLGIDIGMAVATIGERHNEGGVGTGQILALLSCKDDCGRDTALRLMRDASHSMKVALYWLTLAHITELMGCRDSSVGEFFMDGFVQEEAVYERSEKAYVRLDTRRETCGFNVPAKLSEGLVKSICFELQHPVDCCAFEVTAEDAVAAVRGRGAGVDAAAAGVGGGDGGDIVAWLLGL